MTASVDASTHATASRALTLSVVIPAYNEAVNIRRIVERVQHAVSGFDAGLEIVFIDDGSSDGTFDCIRECFDDDPRIKGLRFSRNFGKEAALLAGLRIATGDVVVTIDADLQHPPSVILSMLKKWQEGAIVVHAVKRSRGNEKHYQRLSAKIFNLLMYKLTGINLTNSSDFKLLDRIAVDVLINDFSERRRFYRALAQWIGYKSASVEFDVAEREGGDAKMSFAKLLSLATLGLVAFTAMPLRIVGILGAFTLALGVLVGGDALLSWWQGRTVSGFATLVLTVLAIGSCIMISLGIIGEYIAKIYEEIKARPSYIVEFFQGCHRLQSRDQDTEIGGTRGCDANRCGGDSAQPEGATRPRGQGKVMSQWAACVLEAGRDRAATLTVCRARRPSRLGRSSGGSAPRDRCRRSQRSAGGARSSGRSRASAPRSWPDPGPYTCGRPAARVLVELPGPALRHPDFGSGCGRRHAVAPNCAGSRRQRAPGRSAARARNLGSGARRGPSSSKARRAQSPRSFLPVRRSNSADGLF